MVSSGSPSRPTSLRRKLLLAACSMLAAGFAGEVALRAAGGYRWFTPRLQRCAQRVEGKVELEAAADLLPSFLQLHSADDLDPAWIELSPPPVPHHAEQEIESFSDAQWLKHYCVNETLLRAVWVKGKGLMWNGALLPDAPTRFNVFAPPGGKPQPFYRYPASTTFSNGLTTNAFGFRGRELTVDKPERTVRIAFVGGSTTVEAPDLPHSAPELIETWLQAWAQRTHRDVRFETLNAARVAMQSSGIRAIVADEVLPLAIDYVVYYEGANQLRAPTIAKLVRVQGDYDLGAPPPGLVPEYDERGDSGDTYLERCARYSAAAQYLRGALARDRRSAEPAKPAQEVVLPPGFTADRFPLDRADEVLQCGAIGRDLDAIAARCAASRAKFVMCTFAWLVHDGLTTHAVKGRNIHINLNREYWPFSYASMRRLVDLQNQFLAAWSRQHGVLLIDVAAALPADERLFNDAIHQTGLGVRLKAWVMLLGLLPILARDLDAGTVPVPDTHPDARHPNIGPNRVLTSVELDAGR